MRLLREEGWRMLDVLADSKPKDVVVLMQMEIRSRQVLDSQRCFH